jgi:tetratricopeptide (TPR) repeat protein
VDEEISGAKTCIVSLFACKPLFEGWGLYIISLFIKFDKKIALASKKPPLRKQIVPTTPEKVQTAQATSVSSARFLNSAYLPYLIISLFTIGIYFNTLWDKYAIDDTLVLTENKFTLQGFGGIKDIMTHDAFVGFFGERGSELVSGGRYRPLSIVTLAIEVEFFGLNPAISHGVNVILFTLTCLLLYHLLRYLLPQKKDTHFYTSIAFIATMLYAGHPIHTEAVANIKGRDEIMGLLFSLLALYAAVKYVKTQNFLHLLWGMAMFFLGLLSKENVITFLAIVPLTYYFFTKATLKNYLLTIGLYIIPIAAFLFMRTIYTKAGIGAESPEILNNPFAYLPKTLDGYEQRYATVIMTFLLYFKLLIFPHPLTTDYYYNQIPFVGITDPLFILSLLVNAALLIYAVMGLRQKKLPAYAILFYFITFSIVSNVFFTVGILMNERFAYMCSIGFCLLAAWLLVKAKDRFALSPRVLAGILTVVLLLYSIKTISRNFVWKDNLTIFLVDSKVSTNSAKLNMSAGGDLTKLAEENFDTLRHTGRLQYVADLLDMNVDVSSIPDSTLQRKFLELSIQYLNRTLVIYPTHSNAWLLLGNAEYKLHKDPQEAKAAYQKAVDDRVGGYYDAWYNMGCVEVENNMPALAKEHFLKAIAIKPDEFPSRFNLAVAYMNLGNTDSALIWFKKTLELKPLDAVTYYKMGTIYGKQLGNLDMAIKYITKAIEYNPNEAVYYEDLGVAYGLEDKPDDAIRVSEQCLKRFPAYVPALRNISISYRKKGDLAKANEYDAKIAQLSGKK